jgi:hypothetical protein
LEERGLSVPARLSNVRLVDATVVSKPGSKGTDWRLHVGLDLERQSIRSVEVTGVEGGETFRRLTVEAGEVIVGDRGYSHGPGLASVMDRGGHIVVRLAAHLLKLYTPAGHEVQTLELLSTLSDGEVGDWTLSFRSGKSVYPIRLVAVRKSTAAAERELKRIRSEASRKGRKASIQSLIEAQYIAVVTDLKSEQLGALNVLELYRLRWQIEIAFKRLKSLLDLDRLRAKDPALARCYLHAKILAAILIDDLCDRLPAFSPWGYPLLPASRQPLAITATLD